MAINIKKLERITTGLGYICIFWAWLEDTLDFALETIVPLEKGDTSRSVAASIGLRDKIKIIRAIAFLKKLGDDDWFKKLDALLNEIDKELRPERNRFIHDSWARPSHTLIRRTKQAKFQKPQAFARELSTEQKTPVRMKEVWALAHSILDAQLRLIGLMLEFEEVQKYIEEEVDKRTTVHIITTFLEKIRASQDTPSPQTPRQAAPGNRHSKKRSKPAPRRQSSRG